jgi:hypothetical protein
MAEAPHYERYKAFGDYHNALFTPDGMPITMSVDDLGVCLGFHR